MLNRLFAFLTAFLASQISIVAQIGMSGAGYLPPAPVSVAPGQLITFFVNLDLPTATANAAPLPLSLAGTSVRVFPQNGPNASQRIDVPVVAVYSVPVYSTRTSGYNLAAVTVQIPFEVQAGSQPALSVYDFGIFLGDNQSASALLQLAAQPDAVRIIRSGDTLTTRDYGLRPTLGPFPPAITHADGSTVTPANPAHPGETVSVWAVGLGLPSSGTIATGSANPNPPLTTTVSVDFDFRSNAGPSMPSTTNSGGSHVPAIKIPAYFAPGFVGLYQINVTIPAPPVQLESCGGVFQSNLTVNLGGTASYDGAGICVSN